MANDKKKPSLASQGAVMRRVLRYIGPHVSLVVLSLALCLISVALTLYVPILVGRAVDCIVGPNAVDFAALTPILMTIAVCIVIAAAAQWVMNALHNSITYDTVRDIRRDAFAGRVKVSVAAKPHKVAAVIFVRACQTMGCRRGKLAVIFHDDLNILRAITQLAAAKVKGNDLQPVSAQCVWVQDFKDGAETLGPIWIRDPIRKHPVANRVVSSIYSTTSRYK